MTVTMDAIQGTTGGSRSQTYKHRRATRRVVHLGWAEGEVPYLVMTCHPGAQPDGEPIKLDQVASATTSSQWTTCPAWRKN